jgi:hypothetical protein
MAVGSRHVEAVLGHLAGGSESVMAPSHVAVLGHLAGGSESCGGPWPPGGRRSGGA